MLKFSLDFLYRTLSAVHFLSLALSLSLSPLLSLSLSLTTALSLSFSVAWFQALFSRSVFALFQLSSSIPLFVFLSPVSKSVILQRVEGLVKCPELSWISEEQR